ncbi:MAG: ribosome hibernation-promoting factor, HPF/YfiA family [Candidatus Methylomirabilia bacterium]
MHVIISGRGVITTPAFKARVEEKVQKLSRILPKIHEAKVVLSAEKYRRTADVTLLGTGKLLHSKETAQDLSAAVDLAVDVLTRQVRHTKDRIRQRKPRVSPRRASARKIPSPGEGPAEPQVVPRSLTPKPMSIEEATMQFKLRRDRFFVFTNAVTKTVNVLYRRKDGSLGLIEPIG